MSFIHEDFLLHSDTARRLYHEYAADEPILDYHSHLLATAIAENYRFRDLTEIWLEGDHYKWRAMRANGVKEYFCTADASPYEKFLAWAETVPFTLRNPLYHWTHLELKRYFGVDHLLDAKSAQATWDRANSLLRNDDLSVRGILRKFRVRTVCTTDDPCDDLTAHHEINTSDEARESGFRVYPTFRPDRALEVNVADRFNRWIGCLERASNTDICTLQQFLDALKLRHDYFHKTGARLSDHGLPHCYAKACSEPEAAPIFDQARSGKQITTEQHEKFASLLMLFFGHLDAQRQWTKQLHLGALRSVNSWATKELGTDTGYDCIGDCSQATALSAYLNLLDQENSLPRMVLYNVNPADNYVFATAAGTFHDGATAGKIQFGSGWWFLDQKEGMTWQLNALSNTGLLSRFIGMTTDSRSFMSFPRHEYFRRLLCDMLGREMENGELPNDEQLVGPMVKNICFENARQYFGIEVPTGVYNPLP